MRRIRNADCTIARFARREIEEKRMYMSEIMDNVICKEVIFHSKETFCNQILWTTVLVNFEATVDQRALVTEGFGET